MMATYHGNLQHCAKSRLIDMKQSRALLMLINIIAMHPGIFFYAYAPQGFGTRDVAGCCSAPVVRCGTDPLYWARASRMEFICSSQVCYDVLREIPLSCIDVDKSQPNLNVNSAEA
jgi:hypothetical protein